MSNNDNDGGRHKQRAQGRGGKGVTRRASRRRAWVATFVQWVTAFVKWVATFVKWVAAFVKWVAALVKWVEK